MTDTERAELLNLAEDVTALFRMAAGRQAALAAFEAGELADLPMGANASAVMAEEAAERYRVAAAAVDGPALADDAERTDDEPDGMEPAGLAQTYRGLRAVIAELAAV